MASLETGVGKEAGNRCEEDNMTPVVRSSASSMYKVEVHTWSPESTLLITVEHKEANNFLSKNHRMGLSYLECVVKRFKNVM